MTFNVRTFNYPDFDIMYGILTCFGFFSWSAALQKTWLLRKFATSPEVVTSKKIHSQEEGNPYHSASTCCSINWAQLNRNNLKPNIRSQVTLKEQAGAEEQDLWKRFSDSYREYMHFVGSGANASCEGPARDCWMCEGGANAGVSTTSWSILALLAVCKLERVQRRAMKMHKR